MRRVTEWLTGKWAKTAPDATLIEDYRRTFGTDAGQRVLRHWLDTIYCSVYEGHDPLVLAAHNGRRSVIHDILVNLDYAEQPEKYQVRPNKEGEA